MATDRKIAFSANAITVAQANPGLDFTAAQLQALNQGTLVLIPGGSVLFPGTGSFISRTCIKSLRYEGDERLVRVEFENGQTLQDPSFPGSPPHCVNLKEFRGRLQESANSGHGVSMCYDSVAQTISMLNIYPCECTCEKRGG